MHAYQYVQYNQMSSVIDIVISQPKFNWWIDTNHFISVLQVC